MTKEQINSYTMRISQANTSALAVILYELVIAYIEEALENYGRLNQPGTNRDDGNVDCEEEMKEWQESYDRSLVQAQNYLQELMSMSRMDSEVAADTMSLYLFISKQILMSRVKCQPVHLEECLTYLNRLHISFREMSKTDYDSPIMENTQQVYAGLTYGKGYLNESLDPMENINRGLKA